MKVYRASGVTARLIEDQLALVDPEDRTLIALNATGAIIWDAMASPKMVEELEAELHKRFKKIPVERLSADLNDFLGQLVETGLAVIDDTSDDGPS